MTKRAGRMVITPAVATATAEALTLKVKQNWKDWMADDALMPPDDEWITRDDLVNQLQAEGIDVTANDLIFWQGAAIVPYPIKRHEGRTGRAYYPPWFKETVRELRRLQREGKTLDEIRTHLQGMVRGHRLEGISSGDGRGTATVTTAVAPKGFQHLADALARMYQDDYQLAITRVGIELTDERGVSVLFTFGTDG